MPDPQGDRVAACLALSTATFKWCERRALSSASQGNAEHAARWCALAGRLTGPFASETLASPSMEEMLRQCLPASTPAAARPHVSGANLKWLHVFSASYSTGGHTALARRWIDLDSSGDLHDLVLTSQDVANAAPALVASVRRRGGSVQALTPIGSSFVTTAEALRTRSAEYDAIVLHVHPWDTVPVIAFGAAGGPPVFFVNHADHLFWFGSSVADQVLNIRPSGEALCHAHRGTDRWLRLALPLADPAPMSRSELGQTLRAELGIAADEMVYLTIGTAFKYHPMQGFSFLEAAEQLLIKVPSARLIAVGPSTDEAGWAALKQRCGGRVHAVGVQTDIQPYLAAADVYLEGFPFGSLTALLEAVLAGLPPVLAPAMCPLPYRSDDFSLAALPVPEDVNAYVAMACALAADPLLRRRLSSELALQVRQWHCQPQWSTQLEPLREMVLAGMPHVPKEMSPVHPLDSERVMYWATFILAKQTDNAFSWVYRAAMEQGLRPAVDLELFSAIRTARTARVSVSNPFVALLGSAVLSRLPRPLAQWTYARA